MAKRTEPVIQSAAAPPAPLWAGIPKAAPPPAPAAGASASMGTNSDMAGNRHEGSLTIPAETNLYPGDRVSVGQPMGLVPGPGQHVASAAWTEPPVPASVPMIITPRVAPGLLSRYVLAQTDPAELAHILKENFGNRLPDPGDLVRVTIPTGGGTRWKVQTPEGVEETADLSGIIVHWRTARALWLEKFGMAEAGPPTCSSNDGEHGEGSPGGDCGKCFFNLWGSGELNASDGIKAALADPSRADGMISELTAEVQSRGNVKGGKKWCKEMRLLFLLRESDLIPIVVSLPAMSIKPFLEYTRRLLTPGPLLPAEQGGDGKVRRPQPISGIVTRMTLTMIPHAGKRPDYSEARFACVDGAVLGPAERDMLRQRVALLRPIFDMKASEAVRRSDVDWPEGNGSGVDPATGEMRV